MPKDEDPEKSVNPPHNTIRHEEPDAMRMRLYWHHKRADSLEDFYTLYPLERPPARAPKPRGRGGR